MTSEPRSRFLGFWIVVEDEPSARYAVRMAGLPVFLMGLNAALVALIIAVRPDGSPVYAAFAAVVAMALVVLSFRVRAGRAGWLPALIGLFFLFLAVNLAAMVFAVISAADQGFGAAFLMLQVIVPAFLISLALSGLRGWRWLRRHRGADVF